MHPDRADVSQPKAPRQKKRKLGCEHCCQGSFVTDASGKNVCGCQPNGGACTTASASSPLRLLRWHHLSDSPQRSMPSDVLAAARTASASRNQSRGVWRRWHHLRHLWWTTGACIAYTCAACTTHTDCPTNHLCRPDGSCQPCDVCKPAGACAFTSIQAAIDATPPRDTIYVCPGSYAESKDSGSNARIERSLQLIGAGDGADPATNTLVIPQLSNRAVMGITATSQDIGVALVGLRLTGGTGANGYGLSVVTNFGGHVTGSSPVAPSSTTAMPPGGGLAAGSDTQLTLTNTHITANTGNFSGGRLVNLGHVSLDTLSRVTGNTATSGNGGIFNFNAGGVVDLPSVDNVTGNTSPGTNKNCGGNGMFNGPGAACLMT